MTPLALLALGVWIVLFLARGRFWDVGGDLLREGGEPVRAAGVLAVVPARDEADMIGRSLPTLLAQEPAGAFHVLVVDDGSEDGTADVARRAAQAAGLSDRLTVLRAAPPPPGWAGKLWAMEEGMRWAALEGREAEFVLFTDADIAHAPGLLRRLAGQAERDDAVLVSLMARLATQSRAERWLVPPFVYFFRMLYPFRWVNDTARRTAAAAGGVMLVRRGALEGAGGLAAIRGALIDDCALGRLLKGAGPVRLLMTREASSLRPYARFGDIRRMVVRSAYAELRYRPERLAVALLGLALVFAVPPLALLLGGGAARLAGAAATILMMASFVPMLRFYGLSPLRALGLPAVAAIYGAFTVESALAFRQGRGGAWKGRFQAPSRNGRELPQ